MILPIFQYTRLLEVIKQGNRNRLYMNDTKLVVNLLNLLHIVSILISRIIIYMPGMYYHNYFYC